MPAPTTLKDTRVKRFSPAGLSDSLDATDEFPGACSSLSNLVPDLTTRNIWTCRPAATKIMDFSACPNLTAGHVAGGVSVEKVVGGYVYGMVEDITGGFDFCFGYNLSTNTWITVTPVTGTLPKAFATIATPAFLPTMDLVGVYLCVTHPGYSATSDFFGYFDLTNPSVPAFTNGDLTSGGAYTFSGLGSIPTWVKQFNERAYFGVNGQANGTGTLIQPSVIATDVLALKVTNAGQALTFGDTLALTAAAPLGLSNQLGGIIQSLMVFKGVTNIYQITGDYALSNWTVNTLNVATGTLSPRSVVSIPLGLAFISPAGLRIIDQNGTVSDPIGIAGQGVNVPFTIPAQPQPNLTCAGCDGVTLKVSLRSIVTGFWTEYWYNLPRKVWSGPHGPFASSMFDIYNGNFISVPDPVYDFNLYYSPTDPMSGSTFTEINPLTFTMQSASLEDSGQMAASEVAEYQVVGAVGSSTLTAAVSFVDSNGNVINTANVTFTTAGLQAYHVDFPAISVFNRLAIQITGNSAAGVRIGDSFLRLRTLSYLPPPPSP